jgi:hypothetical protein
MLPVAHQRRQPDSIAAARVYTTTGKERWYESAWIFLTAGIVFLLIAFAHLARIVFGVSFVVRGISVPMWASLIALVISEYLAAYEGFHFARRVPSKT